ncbi:heat shock protein, Hsp20 family protein [Entamoeba histolytica HM-1:IMSS-B]|uniref:Heat shock protein, Hsp20 family n=7 Tax=Entamoeba histolytica TaxID=5759 RepID=A0A8U0WPM5_ENTH1|nr:heat shock protein, Hsp20 family [Entamoeba histolytica HM-1:IMSS]AAM21053.1 small heat shock protein [Entamoeba histolytica]EMD44692.1 heat shock protein Hsp20 family protein [Entamoeba histolytica KU27]EMH76946.1 heat shock protein, Hsp20 family protein [Entamoeba histolytica HM-1:IMSS-B]EMS14294.1 heat shock protein, Hsp20 family protein [Entamoeba histolytica HM-3:IMSS]ENY61171.1 heat shock protein, Hsp20 family protein, putative [Entamoeba histolytica HM-1:IMSS-A]|eukprot:XP_656495.1 heat shock protein, Hsp20 family [Entamoeba histolytica HM-1:IMSS]
MHSQALVRPTPFNPFIQQQRNQKIFVDGKGTGHWAPEIWEPPCELLEAEQIYLLKLEVPGIDKKTLSVKYANNWVVITGTRQVEGKIEFTEFLYGTFRREIPLPTDVDGEKIKAKYQDGILAVVIPKKSPMGWVKVDIN